MYPYPAQSIPGEGSRPQPDAFQQYYQRQSQDRQYAQPPQQIQQQPQPQPQPQSQQQPQPQPAQTQGTQSPYYQGQYAPYYYQMPLTTTTDASQSSNPQERYQSAGIYGYGGGYAAASAPPGTAAGAPAAAPAPGSRPTAATYTPYYSNDFMMPLMYPQQAQAQQQAQAHQQAQQQAAQPQAQQQHPGSQVQSPYIAAQRSMYGPGQPAAAAVATNQFRGMQAPGPQTSQPQLAPMPMTPVRAPTSQTPQSGHRATVSTHLSAIPATMPVTDPTGQTAPPGIKPRVTTTLWEDEGTTCFQVEARGYCVARREDNDMINGTKLLNVAGMTRGRRDGLLKGERSRHVVKAGAMHLKGVWIPYDRALDFANKERIVDLLYPLFVTDIKSVLYHPANPDMRHATAPSAAPGSGANVTGGTPQAPQQHQPHPQAHPQLQQHVPQGHPGAAVAAQVPHQDGAPGGGTPSAPKPGSHTPSNPVGGAPQGPTPQGAPQGPQSLPSVTGGAPGPVIPVVGGAGQPGNPSHVSPVLPQIESQGSEPGQGINGSVQLPQLAAMGAVQPGIDGHQSLPQPYALDPIKPKSEIDGGNGQPHPSQHPHYGQQHSEKGNEQYYSYDASQAAPQQGNGQQQPSYYS